MKNRFLYIALSLISVLTSCKDDEFEPLNNVAECTWHVSTDQENVSPIQLNLNNYISIMDLSKACCRISGLCRMMVQSSLMVRWSGDRQTIQT